MHWEKKICFRITIRRIVGAILAASTVANLIIVGVVFGAESLPEAPTITASPSMTSVLSTSFSPTVFFTDTVTAEATPTSSPGIPPTDTPAGSSCIPRYDWPTYQIQQGNTLFWLGSATGSTVQELVLANCLTTDVIYRGQSLHVPRLPMSTFTPTATATQ